MNIESLLSTLHSATARNDALKFLSQIMVETDPRLVQELARVIDDPDSIGDTNRFASILERFSKDDFIPPLIEAISRAEVGTSPWLADYMYALGEILIDREDLWEPEEGFVHLLGEWLHSTGGGEIAWKSAIILSQLDHPATHSYFLSGATDESLFFGARIACIDGLVNHYSEDALSVLEKLADDPKPEVREEIARATEWLTKPKHN